MRVGSQEHAAASGETQGLTRSDHSPQYGNGNGEMASRSINLSMASKAMKLKLKGNIREISERRQVGDAEEMLSEQGSANRDAWWKNVGMEEGM